MVIRGAGHFGGSGGPFPFDVRGIKRFWRREVVVSISLDKEDTKDLRAPFPFFKQPGFSVS